MHDSNQGAHQIFVREKSLPISSACHERVMLKLSARKQFDRRKIALRISRFI
jgi:hypothetical protein